MFRDRNDTKDNIIFYIGETKIPLNIRIIDKKKETTINKK